MKKFLSLACLCLLPLFLAINFSCSNESGSPLILPSGGTGTQPTPTPQPHTESTNFLDDWETEQFLCINDSGKLDTKIEAPWNAEFSSTLMPDSIRLDVKKEDGWEVAFNLMNKDGHPDANYFGLYNKYTGVLRIFYYYNKEVASTATDFAFEVVLGTDGAKNPAYYAALGYGIPMETDVKTNVNLLGAGNASKTFHFLVTPYSGIERHTMTQGWYAFDVDMSAYTGKSFYTDGSSIQIACRANNKTSVTLGTDILGKIGGDFSGKIDRAKLSASSNGVSGTLGDIGAALGDISKASAATAKASLEGGVLGMLEPVGLWASAAFNIASRATKGGSGGSGQAQQDSLSGKLDLKLNATANTTGYLESDVATNVKQFTMEKTAFNPNSNVGKGVWNIDKSPAIYFISNRRVTSTTSYTMRDGQREYDDKTTAIYLRPSTRDEYGDYNWDSELVFDMGDGARMPYFYDPTSFEVSINRDVFPDAANVKVLSFCGIYENNGNKTQNTAFREALGIGSLDTPKYALSTTIGISEVNDIDFSKYRLTTNGYLDSMILDLGGDTLLISVKTADEYKEADLKLFDGLAYKNYGSKADIHYYGQELRFDSNAAELSFIVEPQIFYGERVLNNDWQSLLGNTKKAAGAVCDCGRPV